MGVFPVGLEHERGDSMKDEALKLALEAFQYDDLPLTHQNIRAWDAVRRKTITAIKQALATPTAQEPVVFFRCNGCGHAYEQVHPTSCDCMAAGGFDRVEYYATPPAAPVQDSTCSETLRAQGKAYPRTCKKCGKGPCIGAPKQPPAQPATEESSAVAASVQEPWGFHIQFNNGKDATFKGLDHLAECEAHLESGETITMIYHTPPAQEFVCSTGLCHYRKPLTDEQISAIGSKIFPSTWNTRHVEFARAIEAAHGITKGQP
jgi:hypothetical protein